MEIRSPRKHRATGRVGDKVFQRNWQWEPESRKDQEKEAQCWPWRTRSRRRGRWRRRKEKDDVGEVLEALEYKKRTVPKGMWDEDRNDEHSTIYKQISWGDQLKRKYTAVNQKRSFIVNDMYILQIGWRENMLPAWQVSESWLQNSISLKLAIPVYSAKIVKHLMWVTLSSTARKKIAIFTFAFCSCQSSSIPTFLTDWVSDSPI